MINIDNSFIVWYSTEEDHDEFKSGLTRYGLKNYPLHIIQDRITPEKLAVEMSKVTRLDLRCATPKQDMFYDSSLTLCTSEFGTFMNRNHNYLQMFMTDMWDSKDSYSHQIKTGSSQFIKGPCLNWIACATPQQFVDNLPEDAASQGLGRNKDILQASIMREPITELSKKYPVDISPQ